MIFIRGCGHSDTNTRATRHPLRCPYCHLRALGLGVQEIVEIRPPSAPGKGIVVRIQGARNDH